MDKKIIKLGNSLVHCKKGMCRQDAKNKCIFEYRKGKCIENFGYKCLETVGSDYVIEKVEEAQND